MLVETPIGSQPTTAGRGQTLLPTAIDKKASLTPSAVWCSLPYDDNDLSRGYEDITYQRFANAIDTLAWFIHGKFGPSNTFNTVAYMGTPDIRYQILEVAIAKTGYKVLFSSHMNSLSGHLSLMEKTNATFMLSASQVEVDDILDARPMKHEVIPELEDLLNAATVEHYPFNKTFAEAKNDPYLILHTSGTTGAPKPIEVTFATVSAVDHHRSLPDIDPVSGKPIKFTFTHPTNSKRMLLPFFQFHVIAGAIGMAATVFGDQIYIPGLRHRMVTTNDILPILEHSGAQAAFISPSMVEELAQRPDIGKYISKLDVCLYGGAPVTEAAGKVFSKYTHLVSQWGMTETLCLIDLISDPEDFAYCGFELEHSGITFEPVSEDLYEMVVRRTEASYPHVGYFHRCPEATSFNPGDLWSPHPDPKKAKNFWKCRGRSDDLICWKDGTKLHPTGYESKHSEHNLIRSAVLAGNYHRQPVLIVELFDSENRDSATLEKIWEESVVPINEVAPTNGRVAKTHIILASPDKPFERNVKGTVARKATLLKYEADVERIYEQFGDKTFKAAERMLNEKVPN